jgi:lipid-A-disaccharide synthase
LKRRMGEGVRFVGLGGPRLAELGLESPFDYAELSIVGIFEALAAYPRVLKRIAETTAVAEREKPDIAILIDSWAFTLRVARRLSALRPKMPLVKYVGPQVWAWRRGRARTLAGAVDHLLSIHSFDPPYFEAEGLATTFVGNSALTRDFSRADPARFRAAIGAGQDDPVLLILPGSRHGEIARVMPAFEDAAVLLKRQRPELRLVIPVAEAVAGTVRERAARWPVPVDLVEGEAAKDDAMAAATVALACSGTVTIELALAGCPMVVGYRVDAPTYQVARLLVKTRYITLFNIAAQAFVAPELVQDDCTGPKLAAELARRLDDPDLRRRQRAAQFDALDRMGRGGPDPSEAAADAVMTLLASRGIR